MVVLNAASLVSGGWNHYINGFFNDDTGSWYSNQDDSYKGFWETTSSWSGGDLGTADVYLDSNLNGIWDDSDELIGNAEGFWHGTYSGGVWDRIEGLKNGYFGGSAFGQFFITSEMRFEGAAGNDVFAGSENDDLVYGRDGNDKVYASDGNDVVQAHRGSDTINGGEGDDILRAGNGRDIITGEDGSDKMYGGFGLNTFEAADDGDIDQLFFKSDQHAYNWIYDKDGNSPNGEKADKIMELDPFDEIFVQGVETEELDFQNVVHYSNLGETLDGIGIYASGTLEAVYVGDDLSLGQIEAMTQGIL